MVLFRGARRTLVARALLGRLFLLFWGGSVLSLGACGRTSSNADDELEGQTGSGSRGGNGGMTGSGGENSSLTGGLANESTGGTDGSGGDWEIKVPIYDPLERSCEVDFSIARIKEHVVERTKARVFFTWTTEEQEQGLRDGDPLYSVGVVPEKGRGRAADLLFAQAEEAPDGLSALVSPHFQTCRYGWPHPWATRIGLGGEDYGDKLVRIELKPEAWVGMLDGDGAIDDVFDVDGKLVDHELVRAHPERIGALYFNYFGDEDAPYCGTFGFDGAGDYREFVLGNADMVLRYEIGTEPVLGELNEDIKFLADYLTLARQCSEPDAGRYAHFAACNLDLRSGEPYLDALALPGPAYLPTVANLEALIDMLKENLIASDLPFIREDE